MNIVAVDDKKPVLLQVQNTIEKAVPQASVKGFTSTREALDYAEKTRIDIAFLDIDMGEMNGLVLAKRLKEIHGGTNIIFITGYSEYAIDAWDISASGFILKPATVEAVSKQLDNLRNPIEPDTQEHIRINCFGNFNIFIDGKPLIITREKPKELLAYLVHKRGSLIRTGEIAAVLWEDKAGSEAVKTNMRQVLFRLMNVLKEAGIEDIIIRKWDKIAIDVNKVSCDYYDFIDRKISGINAYTGEYMNEYSWAEFTISYLDNKVK